MLHSYIHTFIYIYKKFVSSKARCRSFLTWFKFCTSFRASCYCLPQSLSWIGLSLSLSLPPSLPSSPSSAVERGRTGIGIGAGETSVAVATTPSAPPSFPPSSSPSSSSPSSSIPSSTSPSSSSSSSSVVCRLQLCWSWRVKTYLFVACLCIPPGSSGSYTTNLGREGGREGWDGWASAVLELEGEDTFICGLLVNTWGLFGLVDHEAEEGREGGRVGWG